MSDRFAARESDLANRAGRGGVVGEINWFEGRVLRHFGGATYRIGKRMLTLSAEYTPDEMRRESRYLEIEAHGIMAHPTV